MNANVYRYNRVEIFSIIFLFVFIEIDRRSDKRISIKAVRESLTGNFYESNAMTFCFCFFVLLFSNFLNRKITCDAISNESVCCGCVGGAA